MTSKKIPYSADYISAIWPITTISAEFISAIWPITTISAEFISAICQDVKQKVWKKNICLKLNKMQYH